MTVHTGRLMNSSKNSSELVHLPGGGMHQVIANSGHDELPAIVQVIGLGGVRQEVELVVQVGNALAEGSGSEQDDERPFLIDGSGKTAKGSPRCSAGGLEPIAKVLALVDNDQILVVEASQCLLHTPGLPTRLAGTVQKLAA